MEHLRHAQTGNLTHLSEHFLLWASKTANDDGLTLAMVLEALRSKGVCKTREFSFENKNPTKKVLSLAAKNRHEATFYGQTADARLVYLLLACFGRPVAISLPVFTDPYSKLDNWTTAVGYTFGRVLDPAPFTVVTAAHAICITGFQPDPNERTGGWFTFRNSWGKTWAQMNRGYGCVSATYVDKFCLEIAMM